MIARVAGEHAIIFIDRRNKHAFALEQIGGGEQYSGRVPGASRHKHRLEAVEQGVQVNQMTLEKLSNYM